MFRRSRLTLYFEILEAIEQGREKKTWIMYSTNLSWNLLTKILETLTGKRFVRVERKGKHRRYKITRKGSRALSYHRKSIEGLHPTIKLHE